MNDPIRVCVIDAFPTLREGIVALLEPEPDLVVVAVTGDYGSTISLCLQQRPDVLLFGMDTPDAKMVDIVAQLKQSCPEIKILVFAAVGNETCIQTMINAGATGYLLKTETHSDLAAAIRAVVRGELPLSRSAVASLLNSSQNQSPSVPTKRQIDVLRLVADGHTNTQIAHKLGIRESTVRYHLGEAFRRLDASSRTEAAMKAANQGFL